MSLSIGPIGNLNITPKSGDIFEVMLTFELLTVRGQQHSFLPTNGCSCESVKVFDTENVSTWGALEPPTFGFMPNALAIGLSGPEICCPMFLNTGSDGTDILEVMVTFEKLTVRWQQHSFPTHERMFLWNCQSFETENVSTGWELEHPTFGFMPNALTIWTIRARQFHPDMRWQLRLKYYRFACEAIVSSFRHLGLRSVYIRWRITF